MLLVHNGKSLPSESMIASDEARTEGPCRKK